MKFSTIVVTGGFGFLGKQVVSAFQTRFPAATVIPCSRRSGVDIRDRAAITAFLAETKPDLVIHCAAHVGGIAYDQMYPVEVFEDNSLISINIIAACVDAGIRDFIDVMPNCTYPGALAEFAEPLWWDGPMHPSVAVYGIPRKLLWGSCFAYGHQHDFKAVHLIMPNMYGPDDHFDPVKSHALGALIAKIVNARQKNLPEVEIWGTGRPIREWLYVADAAECLIHATANWDRFEHNEIMNVGIRMGISIKELAEMIREIVGWTGRFVYRTDKPDGAMKKVIIAEKMKEKLNWEPPTPLREGITRAIANYAAFHYDSSAGKSH